MASVEPAAPEHHKVNTWFFMCGPLAVNVFLLGAAWNLHVFKRYDLAIDKVLDMRRDEIPTARGVASFAGLLLALQFALFAGEAWRRGDAFGVDEMRMELLLVGYCVLAGALLLCPWDVLHRKSRFFILRKLGRCLWPFQYFSLNLPAHPTPFVEVYIADGLTSLSKFFQDLAVALLLLYLSMSQAPDQQRESYATKLKYSPLPYFAASAPYVIRATQCLISFKRTSNVNDRFLHLLNTLKYGSSLLVISVGAYPQIMGLSKVRADKSNFFLLCAVFNSMYSFLWDVIMDWGLGQPNLPKRVMFLRHQLLYKPQRLYYLVIAVDFALRIAWVTKWWDWEHYGVDFKMVSQLAEVVRRCVWNNVRVEWQCLKLEILGSKKLSEDSMELEQNMEQMPLMDEDSDDDNDCSDGAKPSKPLHSFVRVSTQFKTEKCSDRESNGNDEDDGDEDADTAVDGGGHAPQRKHTDEMITPAAITVATFVGTTQVTVIDAATTTHQRKGMSPNPSFAGEEEALQSLSTPGSGSHIV